MTQYLEDVEDHLETYLEEISRSIGARHLEHLTLEDIKLYISCEFS